MARRSNDHEIVIDYTTKRLKLLRDANDKALYTVTEEIPDSKVDFQRQTLFAQTDWSGGVGQYDFNGSNRYYRGNQTGNSTQANASGIDTTQPGNIILGAGYTTPVYCNFLTGCQAYDVDGAPYTNELAESKSATTNDMHLIPSTPAQNDAYYFGSATAMTKLLIQLTTPGVGTAIITWEYYHSDTTWHTACVSNMGTGDVTPSSPGFIDTTIGFTDDAGYHTISIGSLTGWTAVAVNSVTAFWIRARVSTAGTPTTQPLAGGAWASTGSTFTGAFKAFCWSSKLSLFYLATATVIYEWDSTNLFWVQRFVTTDTITDMVEYNQKLYVGAGTALWYTSTDGWTYTQATTLNRYANKFLVAPDPDGTSTILYFSSGATATPNTVYVWNDTIVDSGTLVGDSSAAITNLMLVNDLIFVGKTDNLYMLDSSGGVHAMMDDLKLARSTYNFKFVAHWRAATYFSLGYGIGEITDTTQYADVPLYYEDCGLAGYCCGLTADTNYLYAMMQQGTNIELYKGFRDANDNWCWSPVLSLTTYNGVGMQICQESQSTKKLWFASLTYYTHYFTLVDHPISDSTATFLTTGSLTTSYYNGSDPYFDKMVQSLVLDTANCAAGITVTVAYRKDTDTSFTNCTSALTGNGTNLVNLTSALSFKRIQFRFTLASNNSAVTPIIKYFAIRGQEKPETVRVHECVYDIGDEPSTRAGTIRTYLRGARTSTSLVRFADLRYGESTVSGSGTYHWVVCQPGYPQEIEVTQEKGREPELGLKVRWQEVSYTLT